MEAEGAGAAAEVEQRVAQYDRVVLTYDEARAAIKSVLALGQGERMCGLLGSGGWPLLLLTWCLRLCRCNLGRVAGPSLQLPPAQQGFGWVRRPVVVERVLQGSSAGGWRSGDLYVYMLPAACCHVLAL